MEMDVVVAEALEEEVEVQGHPGNLESQFHNKLQMFWTKHGEQCQKSQVSVKKSMTKQ